MSSTSLRIEWCSMARGTAAKCILRSRRLHRMRTGEVLVGAAPQFRIDGILRSSRKVMSRFLGVSGDLCVVVTCLECRRHLS